MDLIQVASVVGEVPPWLDLGPEEARDGYVLREILGGWPDDANPPKYLNIKPNQIVPSSYELLAQRPDRAPVKTKLPGACIKELAGTQKGKVAILFNGGSLSKHDLSQIKVPTIGMNRTIKGFPGYNGPQPDYYCAIDRPWFKHDYVLAHPKLINGGVDKVSGGYRVVRNYRSAPFSFDLHLDGYPPFVPCTTGFLAMQLAVYLGFTEIHCLGLDYGGQHFDGTKSSKYMRMANKTTERMAAVLKEKGGINVFICGSPESACTAFPHSDFSAVCHE